MAAPTTHELFDLSGEVALVTGGARNLGLDYVTGHNLVVDGGLTAW